jgi:hypothetical protein
MVVTRRWSSPGSEELPRLRDLPADPDRCRRLDDGDEFVENVNVYRDRRDIWSTVSPISVENGSPRGRCLFGHDTGPYEG